MKEQKTKNTFRQILFVLLSFLLLPSLHAQEKILGGIVSDEQGEPLIGASILVKGTNNGTVTDLDGNFALYNVPASATIIVSYMGYDTQEVSYKGQNFLHVKLKDNTKLLDEVVVIGYGTLAKKELSSSIVQVNRADFQQGAVGNPMELITGKVAGMSVINDAPANPNAGTSLQIRGATSLSVSNSPLIVIDGIQNGDMRNLAPQDIESMTVLKDGASAAIYGTRGANGVILITTRKGAGAAGTKRVTYDGWFGVNIETNKPDILSADEFRRSMRAFDYGASTDWSKEIRRDLSYDTNHYMALDGATQNGNYGMSVNYKKATGLDLSSSREEYGARFTLSQKFMDNLVEVNAALYARKVTEDWGDNGQFANALYTNPTMPVYNEDGTFYHPNSPTGARNPVEQYLSVENKGNRVYLLGSFEAKLNLLKTKHHNLNTALSYSQHYNDLKSYYYTPSTSAESEQGNYAGRASLKYEKWWSTQIEWVTNYTFSMDAHTLRFMGGYSWKDDNAESMFMENKDFSYDKFLWNDMKNGKYLQKGEANMTSSKSLSKLIGVFGRINYNWNDIIMGSASLRYEGSTKFGPNNKWGYFPAVSLAVDVANMSFMESQKGWINSLKPRVSYGVTGRAGSSYQSQTTYSGGNYYLMDGTWITTFGPSRNPNPDIGWEKGITTNIGVDFELFNRLRGSMEYFDRRSKDLLYKYTAPQPPMVYNEITVNIGTTVNTGFELNLNADAVITKNFSWNTGIVYSTGKTKLTKLSNDVYRKDYIDLGSTSGGYLFRLVEGGKVGNFYGYQHAGIDEEGYLLVYDEEGNAIRKGSEKNEDKRIIGNGIPKHFLSWNNIFNYKDFDLTIFFRGAFGYQINNRRRYTMGTMASGNANVFREAYTKYADVTKDAGMISSWYLENGNYFKLENVSLGYNLRMRNRLENKYVERIRLYAAAKNVFVLTKYSATDPSQIKVNGLEPGVDSGYTPSATTVSVGMTINFK